MLNRTVPGWSLSLSLEVNLLAISFIFRSIELRAIQSFFVKPGFHKANSEVTKSRPKGNDAACG